MSNVIHFPSGITAEPDVEAETAVESDNIVADFTEYAAERAGIITPRRVLAEAAERADEIVAVATVALLRDGNVATAFSTANPVTLLGMLEIAKDDVLCAGTVGED